MNVSLWISRRLRLGGGGTGSPAAVVIAVAGVALALMVMEFTLAIVVGFKAGIRDKLTGFDAALSVCPPSVARDSAACVDFSPELERVVRSALPEGATMRLSVRQPGIVKTDDNFSGVVFLGQSAVGEDGYDFERSNMVEGSWPDFDADSCRNSIVMSRPLAASLGLGVGDRVYSTFIIDGAVKMRRHTIAGLYQSNFGEYDNTVVYASADGLRSVAGLADDQAGRLDVRNVDIDDVQQVTVDVRGALIRAAADGTLPVFYPVDNVLRTGAMYFNWLALLDTNVVVIFILMLAVAGFTLVSSLFILILERIPTIGVLRALGASKAMIRRVFTDMGMRLVLYGMAAGNVLGIGLLCVQKYTHAVPLNPDMYYLDSVPVVIDVPAMLLLNAGVAVAAWLILTVPARVAAASDPSRAMSVE